MSDVIEKLPRYIPVKEKFQLTREEAIERFKVHNKKGYIGTIWYGPYPYINNLCSCENPVCAGIRPRTQFGIQSIFKAEYVAEVDPDLCQGCKQCLIKCQFGAITYSPSQKRVTVDQKKCYGCGVCLHACNHGALMLKQRAKIPSLEDEY